MHNASQKTGKAPSRSSAAQTKRARPFELREVQPLADNSHNGVQAQLEICHTQGMVSLDGNTLSTIIFAVVAQVFSPHFATLLKPNGPTTENTGAVEQADYLSHSQVVKFNEISPESRRISHTSTREPNAKSWFLI
ncbi:hypothetical protein OS493_010581 [Desmophyllum pertusum]|uniref:Uncharacterized protein n=1 Tax=Desmophyllum pertusum TaxID=174260 RepID=A0A9X0D590_9CNID|nr:hypothetical protein OS493_010581 [Desmophyllum pertusum]